MKAHQIDPRDGRPLGQLAEIENMDNHTDASIDYSTKAIQSPVPDPEAYKIRAVCLANKKRYKEALADIDKFIEYRKENAGFGIRIKVGILENTGDYAATLALYKEMYRKSPEDTFIYGQARCLERLGRFAESEKILSDLIKKSGNEDEVALLARARLYARMGKYDQALADYARNLDQAPSSKVYLERAALYKKLNKPDLYKKDMQNAERM